FRAGSVTKPFVATAVLQLVSEGRLGLDDTVDRLLPGILPYGDRITVRRLLNHTAGVPHEWPAIQSAVHGSRRGRVRHWTPRQVIDLVADRPLDFPPGAAWSYSNTGYLLLGLM